MEISDFGFWISDWHARSPLSVRHSKLQIRNSHLYAFSLVEIVVSMLVVSLLFVASLSAVAASQASRQVMADQVRGDRLAHELMSEVLRYGYFDPTGVDGTGPSPGEAATGDRSLFNDVDDFNGWSASPPQHSDGSVVAGFAGWTRQVVVAYVNPASPAAAGATSAQRAKLIVVTVKRGERVVSQVSAIRTAAMSDLESKGSLP